MSVVIVVMVVTVGVGCVEGVVVLGKIIGTVISSEATTDFLFYLYLPYTSLTGIIQLVG